MIDQLIDAVIFFSGE